MKREEAHMFGKFPACWEKPNKTRLSLCSGHQTDVPASVRGSLLTTQKRR